MKIKRIKFQNYTVFEDQQMEFSPGINVIIGENGTGKGQSMKEKELNRKEKFYSEYCSGCGLCKAVKGVQYVDYNGFSYIDSWNQILGRNIRASCWKLALLRFRLGRMH